MPQEIEGDNAGSQPAHVTHAVGARSISVGEDATGNVFITGDNNIARVTLVVADKRLLASLLPLPTSYDNPYRGLDAFYETDTKYFFGRSKLIRQAWVLFQKVQQGAGPRILAIVGASGSGKSSLVRAGLLPELARNPMEGLERPRVFVLRPRAAPLHRLADVLACLPDIHEVNGLESPNEKGEFDRLHRILAGLPDIAQSRVVIVVDQFEELYTECVNDKSRVAFVKNLMFAASQSDGFVSIVVTVRNDFLNAAQSSLAFASEIRDNRLIVQPMNRDDLEQAVSRPAESLGHPWPPALVESLVAQAEGRAGALPLLQFALKELWPAHSSGCLDNATWSSRLVEDFIVHVAGALFEAAGAEVTRHADQRIIRRAFVAMVQLGEGTSDTRRVAALGEIVPFGQDPEYVRRILAPFCAPTTRLVTVSDQDGEPTYELTHEALITSWGLFGSWLGRVPDKNESDRLRAGLRLHRRLSIAARDWKSRRTSLWRPPELTLLQQYMEDDDVVLDIDEKTFVDASEDAWKQELDDQARTSRRLRTLAQTLAVLALFLAIAAGAAGLFARSTLKQTNLAEEQTKRAKEQTNLAEEQTAKAKEQTYLAEKQTAKAEEQTRLAYREARLADSGRLLAESNSEASIEPRRALLLAVSAAKSTLSSERYVLPRVEEAILSQFSKVSGIPLYESSEGVSTTTFSDDGEQMFFGGYYGLIQEWKTSTLSTDGVRTVGWAPGPVDLLAVSPDHRWLVSVTNPVPLGSPLVVVLAWDLRNFSSMPRILYWAAPPKGLGSPARSISFSGDGRYLALGLNEEALVWQLERGEFEKPPSELPHLAQPSIAHFSRGNRWLFTAGAHGDVVLWDFSRFDAIRPASRKLSTGMSADLTAPFFPPDTWYIDVDRNPPALPKRFDLNGHDDLVVEALFNKRATSLVTANGGFNSQVRLWTLSDKKPVSKMLFTAATADPTAEHPDIEAISSDDSQTVIAVSTQSGKIRLWAVSVGSFIEDEHLGLPNGRVGALKISPDGEWLAAIVSCGGSSSCQEVALRLWHIDPGTKRLMSYLLRGQGESSSTIAFSPDSKWLVTTTPRGAVRVWDVRSSQFPSGPVQLARDFAHPHELIWLGHDPWLVAAQDGGYQLWKNPADVSSSPFRINDLEKSTAAFRISPDGKWLVTANYTWGSGDVDTSSIKLWRLTADGPHFVRNLEVGNTLSTAQIAFNDAGDLLGVLYATGKLLDAKHFVQVWSVTDTDVRPTGEKLEVKIEPGHIVGKFAMASTGTEFYVSDSSGLVRMWKLSDQREWSAPTEVLPAARENDVFGMRISPNDNLVAMITDESVRLFRRDKSGLLQAPITLSIPSFGREIEFSKDAQWLLVMSIEPQSVSLFDLSALPLSPDPSSPDLPPPIELRDLSTSVSSISWNPSRNEVAMGTEDGTIFIWTFSEKSHAWERKAVAAHSGRVAGIAYSPDGGTLASAGADGILRLWPRDIEQLISKSLRVVGRDFTPEECSSYFDENGCPDLMTDGAAQLRATVEDATTTASSAGITDRILELMKSVTKRLSGDTANWN